MSYQVLARKWRPRFFDEMVGQEHVLKALINALNEGRLHHAYLFTGTRGVGKTTIARILAKCLNCEEGVSARPCGVCTSCREIAEGRFIDLIEVDAASRTRVEDTRELLDNVQYAPTRGRYKVYLIDEVHMLSTHSFNALLKTLEEPPAHVKFLLATTDPQKLPVTILSRCLQFNLKNMTPERIVEYLVKVLNSEEIGYEESALWSLGRAAQGSMRDALSLTDQAIAYGQGMVGEAQVHAMLGTMNRGRLFRLAEVMAKADASQILAEIAEMSELSPDYDEVLQGLLAIWHKASIGQVAPGALDNTEGDREAILALAKAMNPEDLQLYYQIALQGRKDLVMASEPRQGFEMILLRMLAFRPAPASVPELNLETVLEKKKSLTSDLLTSGLVSESAPETAPQSPEPIEDSHQPVIDHQELKPESHSTSDTPASESLAESDIIEEQTSNASQLPEPVSSEPNIINTEVTPNLGSETSPLAEMMQDQPVTDVANDHVERERNTASGDSKEPSEVVPPEDLTEQDELPDLKPHTWWQWVEKLPLAGLPMSIARNAAYVANKNGLLHFDVDPAQGALYNEGQKSRIEAALQTLMPNARISIELRAPRGETPDQRQSRQREEALYSARQAIEADPIVNQILTDMGGHILDDSIRPVDKTS